MTNKTMIGVTGMPLAGKTTVAEMIASHGYKLVDMGDVVRKEVKERDIPVSELGDWTKKIRQVKGKGIIAEYTLQRINLEEDNKIVITGMRNWQEKIVFEKEAETKMHVVGVWASPETRKKRKMIRNRKEDQEGDGFSQRDQREVENGVGGLFARCDYLIKNDDTELADTKNKVRNTLEMIENER